MVILYFCYAIGNFLKWWQSPWRRWKIDRNIIASHKVAAGQKIILINIPEDLADEYKYQTKYYKTVICEYNCSTKTLTLEKIEI